MNKQKLFIVATLFGIAQVNAQQTVATTGGNASGAGGSSSFSVGQVVYTTATATAGSVSQGVQQPFEIQIVLGINNPQINLSFAVYPNPTVDNLTISLGDYDFSKVSYQLFNLNGKLLTDKKIDNATTNVNMVIYPQAVYLLNVMNDNKIVKTFKIIKNQ